MKYVIEIETPHGFFATDDETIIGIMRYDSVTRFGEPVVFSVTVWAQIERDSELKEYRAWDSEKEVLFWTASMLVAVDKEIKDAIKQRWKQYPSPAHLWKSLAEVQQASLEEVRKWLDDVKYDTTRPDLADQAAEEALQFDPVRHFEHQKRVVSMFPGLMTNDQT